jgi:SAM-dependent methyltransferase
MNAYSEDLAYIHDVGYGGFARAAAPGLLAILKRHGLYSGLVVDLGCGTGIWAAALIQAGYDAAGVDISPAMIELARARAPGARLTVGSLYRYELPPCVGITCLGEGLNYAFDDCPGGIGRFFRRVYNALEPGGTGGNAPVAPLFRAQPAQPPKPGGLSQSNRERLWPAPDAGGPGGPYQPQAGRQPKPLK